MSAMAAVMPAVCRRIMSPLLLVPLLILLTQMVAFSMQHSDERSKLDTHDDQHGPLDEDAATTRSRQKKCVDRTLGKPWTDGIIPYYITNDFEPYQIQWIERAMRDWERWTCVQFRHKTSTDKHWVKIRYIPGCTSRIGLESKGEQTIEFDKHCFGRAMIHHELGHTLGLIHEQQREQRDGYVKIDFNMVNKNYLINFQKYPKGVDNKMGVEYDYYSVMHYTRSEKSIDSYSQTIYTRDPTKQFVIGMVLKPSFLDSKVISLMYKCADRCTTQNLTPCPKDCFRMADCSCFCEKDVPKEVCKDEYTNCLTRAYNGECVGHDVSFMETYCRKSCHHCTTDGSPPGSHCQDTGNHSRCQEWKSEGKCDVNFGRQVCRLTCGVCKEGSNISVSGPCKDKENLCAEWAAKGDCDKHVPYMLKNCLKSCDFCPEDVGKPPVIAGQACADYDGVCHVRAKEDGCNVYPQMLFVDCRRTCGNCNNSFKELEGCADNNWECRDWAYLGKCKKPNDLPYMRINCRLSCKMCDYTQLPEKDCMENYEICPKWALKSRILCYPKDVL